MTPPNVFGFLRKRGQSLGKEAVVLSQVQDQVFHALVKHLITGRRSARGILVRLTSCSRSPALADFTTQEKQYLISAILTRKGAVEKE